MAGEGFPKRNENIHGKQSRFLFNPAASMAGEGFPKRRDNIHGKQQISVIWKRTLILYQVQLTPFTVKLYCSQNRRLLSLKFDARPAPLQIDTREMNLIRDIRIQIVQKCVVPRPPEPTITATSRAKTRSGCRHSATTRAKARSKDRRAAIAGFPENPNEQRTARPSQAPTPRLSSRRNLPFLATGCLERAFLRRRFTNSV